MVRTILHIPLKIEHPYFDYTGKRLMNGTWVYRYFDRFTTNMSAIFTEDDRIINSWSNPMSESKKVFRSALLKIPIDIIREEVDQIKMFQIDDETDKVYDVVVMDRLKLNLGTIEGITG